MVSSCLLQNPYGPSDCREQRAHHMAHSLLSPLMERFLLVAWATVLTSGACSSGCRAAEGCEQGTKLPRLVYVVLQGCLPSSSSLPISEAIHALGHHDRVITALLSNTDNSQNQTYYFSRLGKKYEEGNIMELKL